MKNLITDGMSVSGFAPDISAGARAARPLNSGATAAEQTTMVDGFSRTITYLRVSVTDRCDLRCTYCMPERMVFAPKAKTLGLDELARLSRLFISLGVTRIRLTGGEPLLRPRALDLVRALGSDLGHGLEELTLTTNGTHLAGHAEALFGAGVRRVNVSLDTLDATAFARITRGGDLGKVMNGLAAAKTAGLRVKINTVALRQDNADEIPDLIAWAHGEGFDLALIETMPLGYADQDRTTQFLPLTDVRKALEARWTLTPLPDRTNGPARYVRVVETGGRLGFITPLTHGFCGDCNRVRLTSQGELFGCLGAEAFTDLRTPLRSGAGDDEIAELIRAAIRGKIKGHDFTLDRLAQPNLARHMSVTGG
jgi:cyclic pyranopterin phosphate synthase